MKIAVIAADGRSGRAFVDEALKRGHRVRAGIFRQNPFEANPSLEVATCNATNLDVVRKLIVGQDAIVSLIGHTKGAAKDVQTHAIENVVNAAKEIDVKRIVSLTGTGVRFPGDVITFLDVFLNTSIKIIDPARVRDGINHAEVLKASGLDWTILRVLKLQNVPEKPFALTENGPTKPYVGRAEVAKALVDILEAKTFIQKAPIISKSRK